MSHPRSTDHGKTYERTVHHRKLRPLDAAEERRIARAYEGGTTIRDLALRHHIGRDRVDEILARLGAKKPERTKLPTHRTCLGPCGRRLEYNAENFGSSFEVGLILECVTCAQRLRRLSIDVVRVSPRAARAGIAGARRSTR